MKFLSIQHVINPDTWAMTFFFLWICSAGVIINHTGTRTDIFFTFGVLPLSISVSIGLTHIM